MRPQEAIVVCSNAAAGTYGPFDLKGGLYAIDYVGTGTGTVTLQRLGPDGTTYLNITLTPAITASSGDPSPQNLPPGRYQVVIATLTASYMTITRVPGE